MSTAPRLQPISVEDYLAGELASPTRHEYVGGVVYAMAGARNVHNLIAGNVFAFFHSRLRAGGCRPYNSDTEIRIQLPTEVRFYYPDVSVICRPDPQTDSFQDEPAIILEVLSRETRRIDEGEKKHAYLAIASLSTCLLIEQEFSGVVAHCRTDQGFVRRVHADLEAVVPLEGIGTELPLAEIYEGVEFAPEMDEQMNARSRSRVGDDRRRPNRFAGGLSGLRPSSPRNTSRASALARVARRPEKVERRAGDAWTIRPRTCPPVGPDVGRPDSGSVAGARPRRRATLCP